MAEYLNQCLKQVGLAAAVFADKHINETAAVEAQAKVFQVFVLADGERFQAHGDFVTPAPLRHRAVRTAGG